MLRTRLIVGAVLIALTAGMLAFDQRFAPGYPFLFGVVALLGLMGGVELVTLLSATRQPSFPLVLTGIFVVLAANWAGLLFGPMGPGGFVAVLFAFAALVLVTFLVEMATFEGPGGVVERISLTLWVVAYLGILPSFLVNLQLGRTDGLGTVALALAIFVPKGCDIGAYFTGRLIGRHHMTPVLSPKKTWEGAVGGLLAAILVAFALDRLGPIIPWGAAGTVLFGITVGAAGILGDLAESMVKRDCRRKDASHIVPGFGGVLDVVDAIVFAAPISYLWLR
ncbi:MAG TPA: phosphatidate cytidylyltransferase [Gemmataceae bacterium]|nr:phosphatidate cytidylyltransferase [Gemmataceae bacterium]